MVVFEFVVLCFPEAPNEIDCNEYNSTENTNENACDWKGTIWTKGVCKFARTDSVFCLITRAVLRITLLAGLAAIYPKVEGVACTLTRSVCSVITFAATAARTFIITLFSVVL